MFRVQRPLLIVTCLFVVQAFAFYRLARNESVPNTVPLRQIAEELGDWESVEEGVLDERTMANLQPDDYLMRSYQKLPGGPQASVMIAYFRRTGTDKAPHSPRNCLPGHGWVPNRAGEISLAIPGQSTAIPVNRYIVAKGDEKAVVLYWYQTATRAVANEYVAKIYLVLDAVRFRRSDTALVRVSVPVVSSEENAELMAEEFSRLLYTALKRHIPAV